MDIAEIHDLVNFLFLLLVLDLAQYEILFSKETVYNLCKKNKLKGPIPNCQT